MADKALETICRTLAPYGHRDRDLERIAGEIVDDLRDEGFALTAFQPAAEGWREVATVIWYDPMLDPFPPRGPHKIIDASIAFMDDVPLGTKLYVPASPVQGEAAAEGWEWIAPALQSRLKTLSSREIAKQVGCGHATICRVAKGKEPSVSNYFAIKKWLTALGRVEPVAEWQVWAEDDFGLCGWVNEEAEMIEHWRSKGRKVRPLYATPPAPQPALPVTCRTVEYKHSSGFPDYYVSIERNGKSLTPYMSKSKGRVEYSVAEWEWLLNDGPKPDILAYDATIPEGATPPAPQSALALIEELTEALELADGRLALLLSEFPDESEVSDHPVATRYVHTKVMTALANAKRFKGE